MIPQRIVILGGSGFVGRRLLRRLADDGHDLLLLSRNLGAHEDRLLPPGVRAGSQGLRVRPLCLASLTPFSASSGVLVLPKITRPACRKRRTV